MANKDYDDFSDLLKELEKDVYKVMETKVYKVAEKVYQDKIQEGYDGYSPNYPDGSRYRRGESGSFHDNDNFDKEITKSGQTIELTIHNTRVSDCNCSYCKSNDTYLDYYIEEGIAGRSSIPHRPISEWTQEELDEGDLIEDIISVELLNKGW